MESIIVIVGFLGAGKTTLLKRLVDTYLTQDWNPYIILNDYANAHLDAQRFLKLLKPEKVSALSGSCICCSGLAELRNLINSIPQRDKAITLIEANGTTDASALMGFLGVGLKDHFLPPIQISVVDVRNWQKRGPHNELEANQIQVSSLIILNQIESEGADRIKRVKDDISRLNPLAKIQLWKDLDPFMLTSLNPSKNSASKIDHLKSHWSSCSVDLPESMSSKSLEFIMESLPEGILRVKGCTKLDEDAHYSFFEQVPSGETHIRPFTGNLVSGPKLLVIGPGSNPSQLSNLVEKSQSFFPRPN